MLGRFVRGGLGLSMLMLAWLPSCSSDDKPRKDPVKEVGKQCLSSKDCASGQCFEGSCTIECESSDDCESTKLPACGVTEIGSLCMRGCDLFRQDYTCVDEAPTACSIAGDGHCEDCGCPSSQRCDEGECIDKLPVGDACTSDSDCKSDNCSDFAGVCRVPVGATCDETNCDGCLVSTGSSYCSRRCDGSSQCGAGECLGSESEGYFCRMPCNGFSDPACPGSRCDLATGTPATEYFCDCLDTRACVWNEAPHPLGARCSDDSTCESGLCDSGPVGSSVSNYSLVGLCTKPCATNQDCDDGFLCIRPQDKAICLPVCDTTCAIGTCLAATDIEGGSGHQVCWAKAPLGAFCRQFADCQTGNCVAQKCAPAGGQPNGAVCRTNDDCASKACQTGMCRGQALQGDPCKVPADCAIGTCCTEGDQAETCSLDCN